MARYSSSGGAPVTPAPLLATPMCVGPGGAPVPPAPLLATPMRVGPGVHLYPLHHFWLRLCVWSREKRTSSTKLIMFVIFRSCRSDNDFGAVPSR